MIKLFSALFHARTWRWITNRRGRIPKPKQEEIFIGDGDFNKIGKEFLRYFISFGDLKKTASILDIGCGIGRMAIPLTSYLHESGSYRGFDVVKSGIEWCNVNIGSAYPNFTFRWCNIKNARYNPEGMFEDIHFSFPYHSESFDFVFLTSVFTHMTIDGVARYIQEIYRTLKQGGCCFATFFLMNKESSDLILSGKSTQPFIPYKNYYTTSTECLEEAIAYDEGVIFDLFERAGFSLRCVKYGSWCGRTSYVSYQDILVFVKR